MLTTEGKMHIKRVLTGWESFVGQSIAFGIGETPETVNDTRLDFETARENIKLTSYDFTADFLVFKAAVPIGLSGTIHEIGLYSGKVNNVGWQFGSRVLTTFDSASEEWVTGGNPATYAVEGSRTGIDSLSLTAATNGSNSATLDGVYLDLSDGNVSDQFSFALYNVNANASSVSVRFKNDLANYFQFTLTPIAVGYQVLTASKSQATVTGIPRWADISSIEVTLNSKASGSSTVSMDAIRMDGAVEPGSNNVLVARKALETPYVKENGKTQEVEFSIGVNL